MIYRVTMEANNVKSMFDFTDATTAINFMSIAVKSYSPESDDLVSVTMSIVEEDF